VNDALFALDAVVAVTAIGGGIALVVGMEQLRFPIALLSGTVFSTHLIPGLILAVVVGGSAAAAAALMFISPGVGAAASIGAGMVLIGWIIGEVVLLPRAARSWLEVFYGVAGVAMAALGGVLLVGSP